MDKTKKNRQGFTLVELLVVVACTGLIAAIVMAGVVSQNKKARDANRRASLNHIKQALEMYHNDHGSYPVTQAYSIDHQTIPPGYAEAAWWSHQYCECYAPLHPTSGPNGYIPGLAPQYLSVLPIDPVAEDLSSCGFCYIYGSNGKDYKVSVYIEANETWNERMRDPFHDPARILWAIAVYTPGAFDW